MKAVLITGCLCATFVACLGIIQNVPISASVTAGGGFLVSVGAAALGKNG
jgi:hypothetical protein